jgi:hypothetical protein
MDVNVEVWYGIYAFFNEFMFKDKEYNILSYVNYKFDAKYFLLR